MFTGDQLNFPDSSKLLANATSLTWTTPNLYGFLFHYRGNGEGEVASRFRESSGRWRQAAPQVGQHGLGDRYVAPVELSGDREAQAALFVRIAGSYMDANHRKRHMYTWLPNHLMDGREQVSPRSFLRALSMAVEVTREGYASYQYALHYEGIRQGVQEASRIRVKEVAEDVPWVTTAVGDLSGTQVPTEPESIVARWTERSLGDRLAAELAAMDPDTNEGGVRTGPKDPHDYLTLIDELCELGVMTRRVNGRVDLPDVYRIAFGIGRRGGVPRIRQ
ncbi:MAG TPA: hypothetical protein VFX70_21360 [Mycobacteriales bacterium]|nr:hypothetical protein [Mycobacteriales bacterium]